MDTTLIIIHLLSIVLWIGGLAFVTIVMFPTIRGIEDPLAQIKVFLGVEKKFSALARIYVLIAGATGITLFFRKGGFVWFRSSSAIQDMLIYKFVLWIIFVVALFGAEKHLLKILVSQQAAPEKAFRVLGIMHWVMLFLTGLAIVFGVNLMFK
jgi:uncharacterized membrane protein